MSEQPTPQTEPAPEPALEVTPEPEAQPVTEPAVEPDAAAEPLPRQTRRGRPGPGDPGRGSRRTSPAPGPGPRPSPAMIPRRPAAAAAKPVLPALPAPSAEALSFGRVDDDGTVYVRTGDGERAVGSYPGASPQDALAYFARKYDEIVGQLELFEQRLTATDVPVGEIDSSMARLRTAADRRGRRRRPRRADRPARRARPRRRGPQGRGRAARGRAAREARARRTALVEEAEGSPRPSPRRCSGGPPASG